MRVAAEHEIDERKTRVVLKDVDVIGFVDEIDDGSAGFAGNSEIGVRGAGAGVIGSTDVEPLHIALEWKKAIDKNGRTVGFEFMDHDVRADAHIVVAQDSEALRGLEAREDLGSQARGADANAAGARAAADKVSGQQHHFGFQGVNALDNVDKVAGLGVLLQVEVGDLRKSHADKGVRQVSKSKRTLGDFDLMATVRSGVDTKADGCCARSGEEGATREIGQCVWCSFGVRWRELGDGHSPFYRAEMSCEPVTSVALWDT